LNWLGTLVLIAGICGSVLIHQQGDSQEPGLAVTDRDSTIPPEDSKKALRSVEELWGKMGTLRMRLSRTSLMPQSKAVVVLLLSMGIAFGCFYAAQAIEPKA